MKCIFCDNEIDDNSTFCHFCGNKVTPEEPAISEEPVVCEEPAEQHEVPQPQQNGRFGEIIKRIKSLPITALAIAAVAVVAVVAILLGILLSGGTTPKDAAQNLLKKGNFTVVARASGEKVKIQVDLDLKNKELTLYAESDGEFAFAVYDGYYIEESYDWWTGETTYSAEDISEDIAEYFDSYQDAEDADWEEIATMLKEATGFDLEEYINLKKFGKCMNTLEKKLEQPRWLKQNAGFSTGREDGFKMYIFEPNLYTLSTAVLEIFEKSFVNEADYLDMMDELEDAEDELEDMEVVVELGVKGRYLVKAEVEVDGEKVKFTFSDIGKTDIDMDELDDILAKADKE